MAGVGRGGAGWRRGFGVEVPSTTAPGTLVGPGRRGVGALLSESPEGLWGEAGAGQGKRPTTRSGPTVGGLGPPQGGSGRVSLSGGDPPRPKALEAGWVSEPVEEGGGGFGANRG